MKSATALLILVLAVMGVLNEYVVWAGYPFSVMDSLTLEFGYCRDASVVVPRKHFDTLFLESTARRGRKHDMYPVRSLGLVVVADGRVFTGEACVCHGVVLTDGTHDFLFTMAPAIRDILYRFEGWDGMVVRPDPAMTDAVFPEENLGDAEDLYGLLQTPLILHGAPVAVKPRGEGIYSVAFRYIVGDTDLGRVHYRVDLVTGEVERLRSSRCGNGPKAVCGRPPAATRLPERIW